jgi:SAM-dependent methyltransferase
LDVNRKEHWDSIYSTKGDAELSWMEPDAGTSLSLIHEACAAGTVIDIGGGTSPLAGKLLDDGYSVAVLDISEAALFRARERLGAQASRVRWLPLDLLTISSLPQQFDVWHDRAVFHFLTERGDRHHYAALLARTVPTGGHAVIATFAPDGPTKCSGLDVCRYDGVSLATEIGERFALLKTLLASHRTPWGKPQSFQYSLLRRV